MASDTLRQTIIDAVLDAIRSITDDGEKVWNTVSQGIPLSGKSGLTLPSVHLIEEEEEVQFQLWPVSDRLLGIVLLFRFQRKIGEPSLRQFNYYLGLLQKNIFNNRHIGGAADIKEVSNNPNVDSDSENAAGGELKLIINYRTQYNDPYTA